MKKYLIAVVIIVVGVALAAPTSAAFWSKWFKPKTPPAPSVSPSAPAKPPEPVVDVKDVERRVRLVTQIITGVYKGPANISLTFTEAEAKAYLLPLANKNLKNPKAPIQAEVSNIILSGGTLEVAGKVGKPINGAVSIRFAPRAADGLLKVDILKVKLGWITLPKAAINKLLATQGLDVNKQGIKMPNFHLTALEIENGRITFKGKYQKGQR